MLQIIFFANLFLLPNVFYFKGDTFCICYMVLLWLGAVHKSRRQYIGGGVKICRWIEIFLKIGELVEGVKKSEIDANAFYRWFSLPPYTYK